MHELRTPVMIRVEASWEDKSGTLQTVPARVDDKSVGGACIRIKTPVAVGTKLRILGPWEQFSGVVKYCRIEARECVVGIQRDPANPPAPDQPASADIQPQEITRAVAAPVAVARLQALPKPPESNLVEIPQVRRIPESLPQLRFANNAAAMSTPRGFSRKTSSQGRFRVMQSRESPRFHGPDAGRIEPQANQPPERMDAGKERKHMARKWFGLGISPNKPGTPSTSREEIRNATDEKENFMPPLTQPTEKLLAQSSRSVPTFQVQLLPVEDIYRAAGIMNPPRGYSVNKVVEMLHSEHIRSLSPEMRRAAVLMALDAAGIPLAQVQQDAKDRQQALDTYESAQTKQVDAEWARKAEEVIQIQAELESIKAHYMARISRNLEGVAREKATFGTWQTMKQQEVESMAEAAELCSKAMVARPTAAPPPEASAAAASGKV
jgi:hypothetical protein